jgi:hypothetical protein
MKKRASAFEDTNSRMKGRSGPSIRFALQKGVKMKNRAYNRAIGVWLVFVMGLMPLAGLTQRVGQQPRSGIEVFDPTGAIEVSQLFRTPPADMCMARRSASCRTDRGKIEGHSPDSQVSCCRSSSLRQSLSLSPIFPFDQTRSMLTRSPTCYA